MSEVKKIATRQAYGEALAELGEKYPNLVVMDADLAASTKTAMFKKKYPERFFDAGIAEANMASMAAGLAPTGKIVFASAPLQCLQRDVPMSRSVTPSVIRI